MNFKEWTNDEIELAIKTYLTEHPLAMDSWKGICEWWLMRYQVRVEIDALQIALKHLTQKGVLEKVGAGESALFRLKRDEAATNDRDVDDN